MSTDYRVHDILVKVQPNVRLIREKYNNIYADRRPTKTPKQHYDDVTYIKYIKPCKT